MSQQLEAFQTLITTHLNGGYVEWDPYIRDHLNGDFSHDRRVLNTFRDNLDHALQPVAYAEDDNMLWQRSRYDTYGGVYEPRYEVARGSSSRYYDTRIVEPRLRTNQVVITRHGSRSRCRSHPRHRSHRHYDDQWEQQLADERYALNRHREEEIAVQGNLLRRADNVRQARRREAEVERDRTEQMAIYEREARDRDAWVTGERRRQDDRIREYNTLAAGYRQTQHDIAGAHMDRLQRNLTYQDVNYGPVRSTRDVNVGLMDDVFGDRVTDRVMRRMRDSPLITSTSRFADEEAYMYGF